MADEPKTVPMRGPKDAAPTVSHDGKTISADKNGVFAMPLEAVETFLRHGFKVVESKV